MSESRPNVDPAELDKFNRIAEHWWDPHGDSRPLHEINPLRLSFIRSHARIEGVDCVDVGCGGGILAEGLARAGARVTGIDMAADALAVARDHARQEGLEIDYHQQTAEAFADRHPGEYPVVTCMELLEHVPDPQAVVSACARLAAPGGRVFFSTLNRNPKSFLFAIVGAEHVLRLLPRGTHSYARFIRPHELAGWMRGAGLELEAITGLTYSPVTRRYRLTRNTDVNYLVAARRPAGEG